MYVNEFPRRFGWPIGVLTLVVGIAVFLLPCAYGRISVDTACADRDAHRKYILDSDDIVGRGADREAVLETLRCIAAAPDTSPAAANMAIYALVHIAETRLEMQEHLLTIIKDDNATYGALSMACRALTYIIDAAGRRALLRELQKRSEQRRPENRNYGPLFYCLAELGDHQFLLWLESRTRGLSSDNAVRRFLEPLARKVRVQGNTTELLRLIGSDDSGFDRGWLVRQALRHGATRDSVRNSAVRYLRRYADRESKPSDYLAFINGCDQCGLFTENDIVEFPEISRIRKTKKAIAGEYLVPHEWMTTLDKMRARFYSLER